MHTTIRWHVLFYIREVKINTIVVGVFRDNHINLLRVAPGPPPTSPSCLIDSKLL